MAVPRIVLSAGVALVAVLGLAGLAMPGAPGRAVVSSPSATAVAAAPAWLEISHPLQLYGLSGSSSSRLPLVYEARRLVTGLERRDILTFGSAGSDSGYLRLAFARIRGPADAATPAQTDLVVDWARIAAGNGLAVVRAGVAAPLLTRFGPFDVADLTLRNARGDAACSGFRLQSPVPIAIAGLACGTTAQPLDRAALACVLDRIDLLSAADDPQLRDAFVDAERRRGPACGSTTGR